VLALFSGFIPEKSTQQGSNPGARTFFWIYYGKIKGLRLPHQIKW
jgi:hypothetical protein